MLSLFSVCCAYLSLCESNIFFSKIKPPRGETPKFGGKPKGEVKGDKKSEK